MDNIMTMLSIKNCAKKIALLMLLACISSTQIFAQTRTTTFLHHDASGSVVAATNEAGEEIWRKNYLPYGEQQAGSDSTESVAYTGHVHDKNLGLTYMKARYYDPQAGRFMGVDPVSVEESVEGNPQMFNRYAYANNNPYTFVDPDGHSGRKPGDAGAELAELFNTLTGSKLQKEVNRKKLDRALREAGGKKRRKRSSVPKSAAPIAKQKQAGHVKGTPQNANRQKANKPTSTFFGEKSGERLTQDAFQKGTPVPGRPGVKDHDFGVSVGTGPNGGMQTKVRVHQDKKGRIHGHPSGQERF